MFKPLGSFNVSRDQSKNAVTWTVNATRAKQEAGREIEFKIKVADGFTPLQRRRFGYGDGIIAVEFHNLNGGYNQPQFLDTVSLLSFINQIVCQATSKGVSTLTHIVNGLLSWDYLPQRTQGDDEEGFEQIFDWTDLKYQYTEQAQAAGMTEAWMRKHGLMDEEEGKPRPCPFCGNDYVGVMKHPDCPEGRIYPFYVHCVECLACGPSSRTEDDAISEWNGENLPE